MRVFPALAAIFLSFAFHSSAGAAVVMHGESLAKTYEANFPRQSPHPNERLLRGLRYGIGGFVTGFGVFWLAGWKRRRSVVPMSAGGAFCAGMLILSGNAQACVNVEAAAFALTAHPASVPGALDMAVEYGLPEEAATLVLDAFKAQRMAALREAAGGSVRLWFLEYWHWLLFGFCAGAGALTALRLRARRSAIAA
jgi:hypothetical protein